MSGPCRFLWSAIVLLSAGCRSLPMGSTALFQLTGDDRPPSAERASAGTERPRALFGSRGRGAGSPAAVASTGPEARDATPLPGAGEGDEDLQLVSERELDGVSGTDPSSWMRKLADADPREIPRLLAERRRRAGAGGETTPEWSSDPAAVETKVRQIILTERKVPTGPVRTGRDSPPWGPEPDGNLITVKTESGSRLLPGEPTGELTAPAPAGLERPSGSAIEADQNEATVDEDQTQDNGGFMASVFDVFGVGGERVAAKDKALASVSIQPAGRLQDSEWPDGVSDDSTPDTPLDLRSTESLQSVYWQEDLEKLIALLETQVAQQSPGESVENQERYIRQHVALRMLYLIASRRPEALQAIPNVPHDEQEFWTQMFWALSSTFDDEAMPDSAVRAAETVAQLRAAVRQMESRAALQLQHTVFCRQIDGFGDYVPFAEDRFEAGQPVLIYTEVKNFLSAATAEDDFRTALRSTITIRQDDVNGRAMFQQDLPQTEDRCRSRRRDYFHSYRIQLPTTLQPGPHVLILEITDTLSGRSGRTTMNFIVP